MNNDKKVILLELISSAYSTSDTAAKDKFEDFLLDLICNNSEVSMISCFANSVSFIKELIENESIEIQKKNLCCESLVKLYANDVCKDEIERYLTELVCNTKLKSLHRYIFESLLKISKEEITVKCFSVYMNSVKILKKEHIDIVYFVAEKLINSSEPEIIDEILRAFRDNLDKLDFESTKKLLLLLIDTY